MPNHHKPAPGRADAIRYFAVRMAENLDLPVSKTEQMVRNLMAMGIIKFSRCKACDAWNGDQ